MRKRFVDQNLFESPWFRSLTPKHKQLWLWLFLHCDMAGVLKKIDWALVSFQIGENVSEDDLAAMDGNVVKHKNIFILPGFIDFQYGPLGKIGEESKSMVHRGVYRCLKAHGLTYPVDVKK